MSPAGVDEGGGVVVLEGGGVDDGGVEEGGVDDGGVDEGGVLVGFEDELLGGTLLLGGNEVPGSGFGGGVVVPG
ncbi:hypothetical protein, partial [Amycolatopsis pittospori]|uniref:hypothetical protein n=1 Tax=Amycolatopsis pittospori TaxID=2749434 RepID=UPI0038B279C4